MTTAENYYEAIQDVGAGTLYFLTRKQDTQHEYVLEPLIIDTKKKELTLKILQRAMEQSNFIAFPGTPEMHAFMDETVADPQSNK